MLWCSLLGPLLVRKLRWELGTMDGGNDCEIRIIIDEILWLMTKQKQSSRFKSCLKHSVCI